MWLPGFRFQKLEQYLLNDLHMIRSAIKLQIEKNSIILSDRSLKTYWISYSISLYFISRCQPEIEDSESEWQVENLQLLSRCSCYLDLDLIFVLKNCFHFLFSKLFSLEITVISVNAKVYFAKFQQKFDIRKMLFLKFREFFSARNFLPLKQSLLLSRTIIGSCIRVTPYMEAKISNAQQ